MNAAAAIARQTMQGPGLESIHNANGLRGNMPRDVWQCVEVEQYAHAAKTPGWETSMALMCPKHKKTFHIHSKHWSSDKRQGCGWCNGAERLQHGAMVLVRNYDHPRRYYSVEVILWLETYHGLNVEDIWKQPGDWLPNHNVFRRNALGDWENTQVNLVALYDNVVPDSMKQEPIHQDLSRANKDLYMSTHGASVYSGDAVRHRMVDLNDAVKLECYTDIWADYAHLRNDHRSLEIENMELRRQIGQAKRAIDFFHTIPNALHLVVYNGIKMCFTDNNQSPLYVPATAPPATAYGDIIPSNGHPPIPPAATAPHPVRNKSNAKLADMWNWMGLHR